MYDLLIIGGGPAGLSAAMTARNRNLSVCVVCGGAAIIVLTLIFGAFYGPASSAVNTMTVLQALWTVLGCACVGALAFCVGFFFLTHGMLRKHLNLQ